MIWGNNASRWRRRSSVRLKFLARRQVRRAAWSHCQGRELSISDFISILFVQDVLDAFFWWFDDPFYFVALYTSHAFTYVFRGFLEYIYFSKCFMLETLLSLCIFKYPLYIPLASFYCIFLTSFAFHPHYGRLIRDMYICSGGRPLDLDSHVCWHITVVLKVVLLRKL